MRITQLELKNIGVFDHQIIDFKKPANDGNADIHILTGINGSGKSTILYALAGIFNIEPVKKRYRFPDERSCVSIRSDGCKEPCMIRSRSLPEDYKSIADYKKYLIADYNEIKNTEFQFAVFAYSGFRSLFSADVHAIREIQNNPLENSLDFENPVNSHSLLQWIANTKAKIAFALQDGNSSIAEKYRKSLARIENAIQEIAGCDVRFTFHYEPMKVGIKVSNEELEFDVLSDGLKSVISWIADLLMRLERMKWKNDCNVLDRNFILFLDEIEIHLHPSWQRKILPVVQNLFRNGQIFIATHSPLVVASVSDAWVYKLSRVNGKMQVSEIIQSKAGTSYPFR
ncbi:MAG: AAA family ATPase [Desulfobacteraceae bacterium]|nr:AAA family ATPase [Desulfobacteraceae bacterium]